jgi:hypothetical protein
MAGLSFVLSALAILGSVASADRALVSRACDANITDGTIYQHAEQELNGLRTMRMSNYRGKVVLIVNVATY